MKKKVIIIGGGVSGLSTAIFAKLNGFDTLILEKHFQLGGLCMSWERKGHLIDGCIHWLTGVNPKSYLYKGWQTLQAFKEDEVILNDNFGTFEYEGTKLTLWSDLLRVKREWTKISPEDSDEIDYFVTIVQAIADLPLSVNEPIALKSFPVLLRDGIRLLPYLVPYFMLSKMTCEELGKKFKHPAIRWVMTHAQPGGGNAFSFIFSYGSHVKKDAGILKGGSLTLVKNMETYYDDLGGEVRLNCGVNQIIIKDGVASGVRLNNGEEISGDYIIAACDANVTFKELLKDKYEIPKFSNITKKKLNNYPTVACCQISYLVDYETVKNFNTPYIIHVPSFKVASQDVDHLNLRFYLEDKETFVKDGKVLMTTLLDQSDEDYYFWEDLKNHSYQEYAKHKRELTHIATESILNVIPQLKGKIEAIDMTTPMTYKRYTGAFHGAYMPFRYTSKGGMFSHSGKIKGVENLLVSGQWIQSPGGLPFAMISAQYAVQRMCRDFHKKFEFKKPQSFEVLHKIRNEE